MLLVLAHPYRCGLIWLSCSDAQRFLVRLQGIVTARQYSVIEYVVGPSPCTYAYSFSHQVRCRGEESGDLCGHLPRLAVPDHYAAAERCLACCQGTGSSLFQVFPFAKAVFFFLQVMCLNKNLVDVVDKLHAAGTSLSSVAANSVWCLQARRVFW
jgi:hypothetical protein